MTHAIPVIPAQVPRPAQATGMGVLESSVSNAEALEIAPVPEAATTSTSG